MESGSTGIVEPYVCLYGAADYYLVALERDGHGHQFSTKRDQHRPSLLQS
jgi:hypothetical protein